MSLHSDTAEIVVCTGLLGVCILSVTSDSPDTITGDIENWGTDDWHDRLPKHVKPEEGVYTIKAEVTYLEDIDECKYNILETSWKGKAN